MGLLDMVTGMLGKKSKQQRGGVPGLPDLGSLTSMLGGGGQAGLMKVLLPALLGSGALAKLGGLGGILGKLQGGGLGNQANSWVGTGQNEDVDPDALESALGADAIDDLAREANVSRDEAKGGLAALLPKLVDQATPGGQIPSSDQLGSILGKVDLKRLMG